MRFLDRRWVNRKLDNHELMLHLSVYIRHLESIADDMPPKLRAYAGLTAGTGLLGGRLIKARLHRAKGTLRIVFQLDPGEGDSVKVRMLFSKVDLESLNVESWKRICASKSSIAGTDEVDLAPGGLFEHRILFLPRGETAVRFGRFRMEIEKLPPDHVEPHGGWREDG